MAPRSLTVKDLVTERIEDLRGNFERNAREYFQSAKFSNKVLDYAPEKEDDHEFHVRKEQLLCGDEHSVVARFGQNIGHVMTSVLRGGMGTKVRFGDYKCVKPDVTFNKVPDIAVMDDNYDVLLVGEAKTPWKHDIIEVEPKNIVFRKYLGQIAGYMYDTNSKYGFLTTYNQTMFFKQEPHPKKNGKWVLWRSPVIRHTAHSQKILGNEKELRNPALYRGKVSLRECFLYFVQLAYHDGYAKNTMQFENWVSSVDDIPKKEDYLSEGSSSESGDDEKEKGHGSNPRLGQQQAPVTGLDLILNTLTLTLTLKAHHPLSVIFKTLGIRSFNLRLRLKLNLLAVVKMFVIRRFNLRLSLRLNLAVVKTLDIHRFILSLKLNLRAAVLPKMLNTEVSHGEIGCSMSVSVRQHGVIILQLAEEGSMLICLKNVLQGAQ
ncbi:hypothetical protein BDV24DRAFT_161925 [Aspergillus arachidicola]|uniref:Uncharacterized protein n=1 Tax=Aspergillus arachidicola TaxID=656916 RepID=A0A5N6YCB7_9EURO|nr:hypothetical protein BDV24DRAFT_161925 [Aspergillus arachidicola]